MYSTLLWFTGLHKCIELYYDLQNSINVLNFTMIYRTPQMYWTLLWFTGLHKCTQLYYDLQDSINVLNFIIIYRTLQMYWCVMYDLQDSINVLNFTLHPLLYTTKPFSTLVTFYYMSSRYTTILFSTKFYFFLQI